MKYLIEFRFHGKAKYQIKRLVHEINKKFRLGRKRAIPHITLAGPFYTNEEGRLIRDFNQLCSNSSIMNFEIDGFSFFENSKVIFLDIKPSKELEEFRWSLAQVLKQYCKLRPFDYDKNFAFHATIAMKLPIHKFRQIKDYTYKKPKIKFKHVMVRATLLKGGFILREYDFFLRRSLIRRLAKDKKIYSKTLNSLKAYFEGKFNPEEFRGASLRIPEKSFTEKWKGLFSPSKTFVTSDLHLDHTNIIKYCDRPFITTKEMNKTLINNWNRTIRKKDTVYFLGDLAYGKSSKSTDYWLKKLNGKIIFIRGNHDKSDKIKFHDNYILEYESEKFYLTHRPDDVPKDWKNWAICGHHHNNKPSEFPFIDQENKRINISVELTKYQPIDFDKILEMIH
jgi:calcineurin-like phosphoesterase family protein/2'-5' RNA ligase